MTAVGGPIASVSLRGRYFSVAEDAESNRKLGGFKNEIQMNGDKTGRLIKSAVPWSADGLTLSCDDFPCLSARSRSRPLWAET